MQVAHWSALLPLAVLLVVRPQKAGYWLVATGFAVSFIADIVALQVPDPWAVTEWFPAGQLALIGSGLGSALAPLAVAMLLILPVPSVAVLVLGSIAVLIVSRGHELQPTMLAYCFAGTVFFMLFAEHRIMPWWYGYQGSRLLAYGLFTRSVLT